MELTKKLYNEKLKELEALKQQEKEMSNELEKINNDLEEIPKRKLEIEPKLDEIKRFNNLYEDAMKEIGKVKNKLNALANDSKEKGLGDVPEVKNLPTMKDVRKEMKIDIDENEQIFVMKRYTTNKKVTVDADLIKKNGKYVVLAGSLLSKHINAESVKKLREKYTKVIDVDYILNRNIAFGTLQRATSFVLGFISNGDSAWILEETGKTIGFYEEREKIKTDKERPEQKGAAKLFQLKGVVSDSGAKIDAKAIEKNGGYVLLKGSTVATKMRTNTKTDTISRRIFKNGNVEKNGTLRKDIYFDDLVSAGLYVTGSTNDDSLKWEEVVSDEIIYKPTNQMYHARLKVKEGKFVLLEGSVVTRPLEHTKKYIKNFYYTKNNFVDKLIESGFVAEKDNNLNVVRDISFDAPTAAAVLVCGYSVNGWEFFEGLNDLRK